MAILIGGLAFAMTAQIGQDDATNYTAVRGVELVELLKSIDAANERLGTQIEELTATRDDLLTSTRRSEDAEKEARSGPSSSRSWPGRPAPRVRASR